MCIGRLIGSVSVCEKVEKADGFHTMMIAEDSVSLFVRDTKSAIVIVTCSRLNECLVLFSTLRILLATDFGIKSSVRTDLKKNLRSGIMRASQGLLNLNLRICDGLSRAF